MFKLEIDSSNLVEGSYDLEKYLVVEPRNAIALKAVFSASEIEDAFDVWFTKKECVCKTRPQLYVDENGVLYLDEYELYPAEEHFFAENYKDYIVLFSSNHAYAISSLIDKKEHRCTIESVKVFLYCNGQWINCFE